MPNFSTGEVVAHEKTVFAYRLNGDVGLNNYDLLKLFKPSSVAPGFNTLVVTGYIFIPGLYPSDFPSILYKKNNTIK